MHLGVFVLAPQSPTNEVDTRELLQISRHCRRSCLRRANEKYVRKAAQGLRRHQGRSAATGDLAAEKRLRDENSVTE
jgi:hypothetical protein